MRKKIKTEKVTLFEKLKNKLGWAWHSLRVAVASKFPKRKKQTKLTHKRLKDGIFVYLILLLPIIQFCIFYIGVNLNSILMVFQTYDDNKYVWSGLNNFRLVYNQFIKMSVFGVTVKNSILSFVMIQLMSPVVLFFTFFIYRKFPGHRFFKIALFLPTIVSSVIMVTVYRQFCEVAIPYLFKTFLNQEIHGLLSSPETRFGAVMFYYMWLSFGSMMLMYLGAMNGISESVVEAARLDGAGTLQEFWYITFPMIYPTFSTLFYTSVASIFTNQINLYAIWGTEADSSVWTFGYYLYKEIARAESSQANYPYLATIGLGMTIIAAPLTFLFKWVLKKIGPTVE